jgi:segregation and condensation protein A
MYVLKLQQFEGPFDLLIDLIENKKLSINEVSLSRIFDGYMEYLKELNHFPVGEVASFIAIAATLMLIKSRSLLPSLKLTEEEEADIKDLETRLNLYNKYREIAKTLEKIFGKKIIFAREPFAGVPDVFIEPRGLNREKLGQILKILISGLPKKEILPETSVKKTISLEQKIEDLVGRLKERVSMCFSDITNPGCDKVDIIVNFLAVLELMRRGMLVATQENNFSEIEISKI